jgi:hypothetical protein
MDKEIKEFLKKEVSATRREYLRQLMHLPEKEKGEELAKFLAMIKATKKS